MSEEKKYLGRDSLTHLTTNIKSYVDGKIDSSLDDTSTNAIQNSTVTTAINSKLDANKKGVANGVAELDASGKVPSSQLPSYVDDIVDCYYDEDTEKLYEHKDSTDPDNPIYSDEITPEGDKIYVDKDSNALYRWTGTMLVSPGSANALTLGETSSTAYRGDRGKVAYDDSQTNKTNIGTMANLETTEKNTLVGAINEVKTEVGGKVDKVTGKGLSTNDYNATEKAEVAKVKDKQNKSLTTAVTVDGVSKSSVEEAISALATLANLTATNHLNAIAVADVFDESVEYAIGDYCIKDNLLYKAKAVHEGVWDAADFDQKQVMAEIISAMVSDYDSLLNQPQIAGNTLVGNKTYSELGIQQAISGKSLSTNDYTDEAKAIVDGVTAALATKQPSTLATAVSVEGGSVTTVQGVANALGTHTGRSVTDNTGAHGLKVTAVSEDEDAIYYKSGNDWKQIQLGSVTQLAEMPTAAAKYVGKIYQFVGTTTQDYKKGYFYECINSSGTYAWQAVRVQSGGGQTIQYDSLPTAEASLVGALLQYVGTTNENYTRGHFYECVAGETAGTFVWKEIEVDNIQTIQYEELPNASANYENKIVQYIGNGEQESSAKRLYGEAFSDSEYDSSYVAQNAFDNNLNTSWSNRTFASPSYIGYKNVGEFKFKQAEVDFVASDSSVTWYIQGSNDGEEWINISNGKSTSSSTTSLVFTSISDDTYKHIRLYSPSQINNNGIWVRIAEIRFVGYEVMNYTNGYYYKCVENDGSYSWKQVNVQPSADITLTDQDIADIKVAFDRGLNGE